MNKSITHNQSYMSLLENSLQELFSPSSDKALLDYSQLNLIDVDQLKVIDFNQLKLLDMKELAVLDFAVLGVFFQYIGAFFLTLSFGFMVAFGAFSLHGAVNSVVFAEEPTITPHEQALQRAQLISEEINSLATSEDDRTTFALLIDGNGNEIRDAKQKALVLGASKQLSMPKSCSFRVVDGKKTVRFANGSRYVPSKASKICVDSDQKGTSFGWNLNSNVTETSDNCLTVSDLSGVNNVTASVMDSFGNITASCDLSLVSSAVMAANN